VEPIEAEVMDEARKRDTRGRKIATSECRAELLAAFDESGLTQRAFARREGVNFHTFVAWLQRRRSAGAAAPVLRFHEVCLAAGAPQAAALEVILPGGIMVRGGSAAAVAELVRALRA
jgi:transposase-like protein